MTKKSILVIALVCALGISAAAQAPSTAPAKQAPSTSAPPQTTPSVSAGIRAAYDANKANLLKSAEKMPEENYGMRPGTQTEVRTFGQMVGHLANANYNFCSSAKGEKNPNSGNDFEKKTSKADLVKALQDAIAYCDGLYASLTDTNMVEKVKATLPNGREVEYIRGARLITNLAHNNEHYGNLVTYMRMKDIVPPSSESRPRAGGN